MIPYDDNTAPDVDPLDGRVPTFDFDKLEAVSEPDPTEFERMADALREIIGWLVQSQSLSRGSRRNLRSAGIRVFALAWVLRPGNLRDSPSLRLAAKRCGVSPAYFERIAAEARVRWGVKNRAQR